MSELVSLAIPTFNRPEGLRRVLDLCVNQDYENLEILVADNNSTTVETSKILDEFSSKDKRVKVFRHQKNIGAINNFNFLVDKASGNFFIWVADDDYFDSVQFVSILLKKVQENPGSALVFPDINFYWKGKIEHSFMGRYFGKCKSKEDYINEALRLSTVAHQMYGLFDRNELNKKEIDLKLHPVLFEQLLLHEIFCKCRVIYCNDAAINVVIHDENFSKKLSYFDALKSTTLFNLKIVNLYFKFDSLGQKRKLDLLIRAIIKLTLYVCCLTCSHGVRFLFFRNQIITQKQMRQT